MLVVGKSSEIRVGVCKLRIGREGVCNVDVTVAESLILQADINIYHLAEAQSVGVAEGAEAVLALNIVGVASKGELACNGSEVAGVFKCVLLRRLAADCDGEGVVEAVHTKPGHLKLFLILLLELLHHLRIVHALGLVL